MRASDSTCLSLFLLSFVVVAPLACHRAEVSGQGGGARSDAPGGMGGGFNLPDGGPGGQGGGPAGAAGGSPGAPADSATRPAPRRVHGAGRVPVDLLLLLDVSTSMQDAVEGGTRLKGELIREALLGFIEDPRSAGLGVGLRFFPIEEEPTPTPTPTAPEMACRSRRIALSGGHASPVLALGDTPGQRAKRAGVLFARRSRDDAPAGLWAQRDLRGARPLRAHRSSLLSPGPALPGQHARDARDAW